VQCAVLMAYANINPGLNVLISSCLKLFRQEPFAGIAAKRCAHGVPNAGRNWTSKVKGHQFYRESNCGVLIYDTIRYDTIR